MNDCPLSGGKKRSIADRFAQSWKELKEDGSSARVGDTEVIPLVGAARSSKVKRIEHKICVGWYLYAPSCTEQQGEAMEYSASA